MPRQQTRETVNDACVKFKLKAFKMSPLVGIFVITLLSSILYNKFDANSRATTQKNLYYWSEKSNAKMEDLKDESNGFDLEDITEVDVCIFTVSNSVTSFTSSIESQDMLIRTTPQLRDRFALTFKCLPREGCCWKPETL